MGEAKRRKQLDPNFGKKWSNQKTQNSSIYNISKMPITNTNRKSKNLYGIRFLDGSKRIVVCPDYKIDEWTTYCNERHIPFEIELLF